MTEPETENEILQRLVREGYPASELQRLVEEEIERMEQRDA